MSKTTRPWANADSRPRIHMRIERDGRLMWATHPTGLWQHAEKAGTAIVEAMQSLGYSWSDRAVIIWEGRNEHGDL